MQAIIKPTGLNMDKKKCTLCKGDGAPSYKLTNSLKRHLKDKHAGHPDLVEALGAVAHSPKKRCKGCGKLVGNIHQHRLACKPKPTMTVNPDDDFVKAFKDRLASTKGGRCVENTQKHYVTQLKKFLRFEKSANANFNPWDWLRWDEREHVLIRHVSEYLEDVKAGTPTQMLMSTCYSKLVEWIEEARSEKRDTIEERFSLRRTSNALVHKELKKGRLVPRQKDHPDLPQPQPDPATAHLDQNITQRVLDAWRTAYKMNKKIILKRFKKGNFKIKELGITNELKARALLSLAIYLANGGIRLVSVRSMTVFELKKATHALVKCPYCKDSVVYSEHKVVCVKREQWLKDPEGGGYSAEMLDPYEDYDSDSGADKPIRWRVQVRKGKTIRKYPYVEVIIRDDEFQTLQTMVPKSDIYKPFEDVDWQRDMLPILKNMICSIENGEEVWQRANPKGKPLGANEFKRLAITEIKKKAGKDEARLMTSLGTSVPMAQEVYDDPKERSLIRSEQLRKYNIASRQTEAIPSAAAPAGPGPQEQSEMNIAAAPAGPSPQEQSDSDDSESGDNYQKLMRTVAKMDKGFKPDADSDNNAVTE